MTKPQGYQYPVIQTITQNLTELVNTKDRRIQLDYVLFTGSNSEPISVLDTLKVYTQEAIKKFYGNSIKVSRTAAGLWGSKQSVGSLGKNLYGAQMPILQSTFVPVTNHLSSQNPFKGTLVVQGQTIYQGVGNPPPPGAANTSLYFKYLNAGVTNLNICEMFNFGLTLDYSGGNFSVTSRQPVGTTYYDLIPVAQYNPMQQYDRPIIIDYGGVFPGFQTVYPLLTSHYSAASFGPNWVPNNLGKPIQFFGLSSAITESGRIISSSARGYTASGIFGNPLMNRQMNLLTYSQLSRIGFTQAAPINPPAAQNKTTCVAAAQNIIATVNKFSTAQGLGTVKLTWAVQDAPYWDEVPQAGQSAVEALGSLAARCSGALRWDGNNNYVVAYPDVAFGSWKVPDCHLIAAGGIQENYILDLGTGRSGVGTFLIPSLPQANNGHNDLPNSSKVKGNSATVTQIAKITKVVASDDPELIFDLPQDFDQVYIQILVPGTGDSGGTNPLSTASWITRDPENWFVFETATLGGGLGANTPYIFYTNVGGRYIPQVRVDSLTFPVGNSSVDDGKFVMSLACSRKDLSAQFDQSRAEGDDLQRMLEEYYVRNYQFVKTYSGTINCMFFGSIPLPGMLGTATIDDLTVSGIIESVSFQFPGFLTVQVARYLRLEMIKPPFDWNATNAGQSTQRSFGYPNGSL